MKLVSSIFLEYIFYFIDCFLLKLARNPKLQEKLRREITEFSATSGGITFDTLNEMKYLDQVWHGNEMKVQR